MQAFLRFSCPWYEKKASRYYQLMLSEMDDIYDQLFRYRETIFNFKN